MKELNVYIDRCLIDEYAKKDCEGYLALDVCDIPQQDITNFLRRAMEEDTTIRDLVYYHMQKMIDKRLPEVEWQNQEFSHTYHRQTA